ncbi:hypothetical protein GGI12_005369, partial [Dipsacomyces acuminosporus]
QPQLPQPQPPQPPQPPRPQQQNNAYSQSLYYAQSSFQPLMVPPPSPTILSYYTTDPTQWMSLLGQNAYQPQAYHYDYPLPPHQLPFNFPVQQPQLGAAAYQSSDPSVAAAAAAAAVAAAAAQGNNGAGSSMLLTQQFAPPQSMIQPPPHTPISPVALPPIDQTLHQGNMAAAAAAAAAAQMTAVAVATGQYPPPSAGIVGPQSVQQQQQPEQQQPGSAFHMPRQQVQFGSQDPALMAASALPQQPADSYYLPARRSSSFTNLSLLQQQQQQQQQPSYMKSSYSSQLSQKPLVTGIPGQQADAHSSAFAGFNKPPAIRDSQYQAPAVGNSNGMTSSFQQHRQQIPQQHMSVISGGLSGRLGSQQQYQFPQLVGSTSARYANPGGYNASALNPANVRHHSLSSPRSHIGLSPVSRASLVHKARQDLPLLFSGPKSASKAVPNAKTAAAFTAAITASTMAAGAGLDREAVPDMAECVPGTRITRQQAMSDAMRDQILQSAHQLYSANARDPMLVEMLLCLHRLHPRHLPTLLLLACAYFSSSQPEKSLEYNQLILKIDPNYVEAMSNIGTTLRSMGKTSEAETWWWQAVKLRPGYWDAVENLMGVLCNQAQPASSKSPAKAHGAKSDGSAAAAAAATGPRYHEALQLCEFVDSSLHIRDEPSKDKCGVVSRYQVQDKQLYRLQSLLYSEGNLRFAMGDIAGARREYEKAMEVVLGGYKLDDIIVRIAYVGAQEGINQMFHQQLNNQQPPIHNLSIKNLPLTLLAPQNAIRLLQIIFPETSGVLPGFTALASKVSTSASASSQLAQANQVASNLLLTLAKLHQDHAVVAQPLSIVLPLYYLSLSLVPSPSTCNNLGIILSAIPSPSTATMVPS